MKLQVLKINDRYAFAVGNFFSPTHFFLCSGIKSSYKYAWEAYRDAKWLFNKNYSHIEALQKTASDDLIVSDMASTSETSAEDMLMGHYSKILDIMMERCKSFKDKQDKEIAYGEVKSIVSGILKVKENMEKDEDKKKLDGVLDKFRKLVREKFSQLLAKDKAEMEKNKNADDAIPVASEPPAPPGTPETMEQSESSLPIMPTAQVDSIIKYACVMEEDVQTVLAKEYSERICHAIEKKHPDAICKIDSGNRIIKVVGSNDNPLIRITINDNMHVSNIEPEGDLAKAFPLHSVEFYQKYWKPIVEKLGHYMIRDMGLLVCPSKSSLPDIPSSMPESIQLMGWSIDDKKEKAFDISFSGEKPSWMFKGNKNVVKEAKRTIRPSKYTEDDFIKGQPRRVQCIDPNLKSILGKIGEVKKVIPLVDHLELEIDFGRLLVRLTENQIELID